jgi:hypothetical protein
MKNSGKETSRSDEVHILTDRIQQLELELDKLRGKKHRVGFSTLISCLLLTIGAIALVTSTLYESPIAPLIGLSLTFWGALLLYIKPQKYVKARLLDSTIVPLLVTISQTIANIQATGKAIYMPPRDVTELKSGKVFMPTQIEKKTSSIEESKTQKKNNPNGIYLSPTGLGLANLLESELGKNFYRVDFRQLPGELSKLIQDLEIARKFQIAIESNKITARATESIYQNICNETKDTPNICNSIGCPFCSAIAIALTRTIGKRLVIENCQSQEGKTVETTYRIIDE